MSLRVALLTFVFAASAVAAEPVVDARDLPRVPPTEAADALKTFRIRSGFRIELAAAEPLVVDPIAICFDESGRLFVVEMRDYSERRDERLGRIKLLEDADNDGRFDRATIYADGLPWPTALFCYAGGLFVGCTPDILYLRDTDRDGVSDEKHVVFTGFGASVQRLNVQALLNSFAWGPDNRIYGLTSFNGGVITSPLDPGMKPLDLRGRNFSFDPRIIERIGPGILSDPRARLIRPESGGGQHGMSFDDFGRWFICSNSAHLQMMMYDLRYADRNPHYAMPSPLVDIAIDGPAAEVYRISPDEPWRVIRTKWRVAGLVGGPIEGGGRASGYFTGATGVTIYRGSAFPPEFRGNAFVGDAGGNLVHRKVVHFQHDGKSLIQPVARRAPGEEQVEFLASTDNWFRPVQFANAPDGCLYVADMYREVIEHPWSLPESIKRHLDLNSGNDRGRIYRIVPDHFEQPHPPRLAEADTDGLVAALEHPNGWHRDTAARLLHERRDENAAAALRRVATTSTLPAGRVHALRALSAMDMLTEPDVIRAMEDADGRVRERALRLSETVTGGGQPSAPLWSKLKELTSDPDLRVQYQLALTLGRTSGPDTLDVLMQLAAQHHDDRWMKAAILNSLGDGALEVFDALVARPQVRRSAGGREILRELVILAVGRGDYEAAMKRISTLDELELAMTLAYPVIDAAQRRKQTQALEADMERLFASAALAADSRDAPEPLRLAAVQLLALRPFDAVGPRLISLLGPAEPQAVRLAAIKALDRFHDPAVAEELLKRWGTFTPRERSEALSTLLRRKERALVLLKAVERRTVQRRELSSNQATFLRDHPDASVRELAARVLAEAPSSTRRQIVEAFAPALDLKGDAARGREIFRERCASCHRLGGEGHALGPDLVTVKAGGKEKLLTSILDPNREVQPNFLAYLVESKSGESHLGLIQSETAAGVTVRQAYGVETLISRAELKRMKSQEQSLMPEGLEEGLAMQAMADLLEYLSTAEDQR